MKAYQAIAFVRTEQGPVNTHILRHMAATIEEALEAFGEWEDMGAIEAMYVEVFDSDKDPDRPIETLRVERTYSVVA